LYGIGKMFSQSVGVEHVLRRGDGVDHDVFRLTMPPPA
jgi:hypothetical protein